MRNPARKIWMYLALASVGAMLFVTGARGIERVGEDWRWIALLIAGATISPISLLLLVFALLHTRGLAKLRAGVGIVARWSVTPDEWEQFRAFDRIRTASGPDLFNDMSYDDERPKWPVQIIVGRKSAVIGDSYQVLRRGGIPGLVSVYWLPRPADPECLEFHVVYPRRHGPPARFALRIPVPLRYRAEGLRVYEHFVAMTPHRPAIALRRPFLTIRIALGVAAVCAAAFAWGLARAGHSDGRDVAPVIAAVVGAIVGCAALLLAVITALLTRRRA